VLFGGAEDAVAEELEKSARGGEPDSDQGADPEDVGTAQGGGGEPLVGADTDHHGTEARVFVEEVSVASALTVEVERSSRRAIPA
jgi:hypothetical protein